MKQSTRDFVLALANGAFLAMAGVFVTERPFKFFGLLILLTALEKMAAIRLPAEEGDA